MHFFGSLVYSQLGNFTRQHFFIETRRSGKQVEMTKEKDLDIGLNMPSCSSFEMKSGHSLTTAPINAYQL